MRNNRSFIFGLILISLGILIIVRITFGVNVIGILISLWPLLLIVIGWQIIRNARRPRAREERADTADTVTAPGGFDMPEGLPADVIRHSSVIGDTSMRLTSRNFKGGSVSSVIGDIHLNLSGIDFPAGEKMINVSGIIGDVNITLPKDLYVHVRGNSVIGDIYLLGQKTGGFFRHLTYQSEGYAAAGKRLYITISLVIGDIYTA